MVEDGSPGSSLLIAGTSDFKRLLLESALIELWLVAAATARVRGRLLGGTSLESIRLADFLCFEVRKGDSAFSSADASRDEGCCKSVVEDLRRSGGI